MERLTASTTDAEKDIRVIIARRESAMRGRDAAAIAADYAPDALKFDLAPPLRNFGADASALQAWLDGFDGEIDYAVTDLAVQSADGLAFCHSLNRLSTTPRGADFRFTLWYRRLEDRPRAQPDAVLHGRQPQSRHGPDALNAWTSRGGAARSPETAQTSLLAVRK